MMPRIWFSGPRLFGLIRPGISFSTSELSRKRAAGRPGGQDHVPPPDLGKGHSPAHFAAFFSALWNVAYRLAILALLGWAILALLGWAIWAFIGWLFGGAKAGTCLVYQDGAYAVTSCEDGTFTVRARDGHVRQYGTPNAGFDRYPGMEGRPVFERRDER